MSFLRRYLDEKEPTLEEPAKVVRELDLWEVESQSENVHKRRMDCEAGRGRRVRRSMGGIRGNR